MIQSPIKVSEKLTVGSQPSEELLQQLADSGFKSVINLSRKGELDQIFQPEEEGEIVANLGMKYLHVPISLSNVKDTDIAEFCAAMENTPSPVYVHCRIGQRSGPLSLIYHAMRRKLSAEKVLEKGERLGLKWSAPMIANIVQQYLGKRKEAAA